MDDRFADSVAAAGVECRPLRPAERIRRRAEVRERVARASALDTVDVAVVFRDFTGDAVTPPYRDGWGSQVEGPGSGSIKR